MPSKHQINTASKALFAFISSLSALSWGEEQAIVEWAPYTLKTGIEESALINAATQVEENFLTSQPGYIRRQLLKGQERQWVDLVFWESEDAAAQASQNIMQSPICLEYFNMMKEMDDPNAAPPAHFQVVKNWTANN